jgi:predicted nucleic acid-binding protein
MVTTLTIVADASALAAASDTQLLDFLSSACDRLILSPTLVDELVEIEVIDELVAGGVEHMIEVVSLTEADEALADQLSEQIAAASVVSSASAHRGEAEAIALMARADLSPAFLLCDDAPAIRVARAHDVPVQTLEGLLVSLRGEAAGAAARSAPRRHEPEEEVAARLAPVMPPESRAGAAPVPVSAPPMKRDLPATVVLDEEMAALVVDLMEHGLGRDPQEVIKRALRGVAAALAG